MITNKINLESVERRLRNYKAIEKVCCYFMYTVCIQVITLYNYLGSRKYIRHWLIQPALVKLVKSKPGFPKMNLRSDFGYHSC